MNKVVTCSACNRVAILALTHYTNGVEDDKLGACHEHLIPFIDAVYESLNYAKNRIEAKTFPRRTNEKD